MTRVYFHVSFFTMYLDRQFDILASYVRDGDRVLDLQAGWGTFAIYLQHLKKCSVTVVSQIERQRVSMQTWLKTFHLRPSLDIIDAHEWRDVFSTYNLSAFDVIILHELSFYPVGSKNWPILLRYIHESLSQGGIFIFRTIFIRVMTLETIDYYLLREEAVMFGCDTMWMSTSELIQHLDRVDFKVMSITDTSQDAILTHKCWSHGVARNTKLHRYIESSVRLLERQLLSSMSIVCAKQQG